MYNPVILEMVAREQERRREEDYRNTQTLMGAEPRSSSIFVWLQSWFPRDPPGHIEKNKSGRKNEAVV